MPISPDNQIKAPRRRLGRSLFRRLFVVAAISIVSLYMLSFSGQPPKNIGATNGRLAELPDSPNCVSTQTDQADKRMPSISFGDTAESATQRLKLVIEQEFSRAKLVCELDNYLHYEFSSLIFRFVDDVEFLVKDELKQIEFRSASRVGHSDLGANRKRMSTISNEMQP